MGWYYCSEIGDKGGEPMIDTNSLRGIIASRGLSQSKVAHMLGITEKTFYAKMKKGVFSSTELEAMIKILEIKNPVEIFFAPEVAL